MEYVMVPVPEELANEAKRFLMALEARFNAARATGPVDPQLADRLFRALNPRCRTALSLLAPASLAGSHLTVADLAAKAMWTEHEAFGVINELSELVWRAFGPIMGVVPSASAEVDASSINWNERVVVVYKNLAMAVVAAENQSAGGA